MIEVINLTISINGEEILRNISLIIPDNKITVIAGKSGGGKSVLIKTIDGIMRPQSGKILIDGVDISALKINELNAIRKKMGLLFQGGALFDSMNVFQNIALPLYEHTDYTPDKIEKIVDDKLKILGLNNCSGKYPADLSGGMTKRVALARATILNPKYIFYDEPTTGLDPVTSDEIIDSIHSLHNSGDVSSVIITHDLYCMNKTAEQIIIIGEKAVLFDGDYKSFLANDEECCNIFKIHHRSTESKNNKNAEQEKK